MVGIGDYIHYHSKNYKEYGIYKAGEGSNDANRVLYETHLNLISNIKKKMIKSDLTKLQNYYTNLLYGGGLHQTIGSSIEDDNGQTIVDVLTDYIDTAVDHYAKVGDVEYSLTHPTSSLVKAPPKAGKLKNITVWHVQQYLAAIQNARTQAIKLAERGMGTQSEIIARADAYRMECDKFEQELNRLWTELQNSSTERIIRKNKKVVGKFKSISIDDGSLRPLLQELDSFLSAYSGHYGSNLAGEGWEALVTMSNIGFSNTLKKGLSQCVGDKSSWKNFLANHGQAGKQKEMIYVSNLSSDYVDIEDLVEGMGTSWDIGPQSGSVSASSTGTVDVIVRNESNEALAGIIAKGEELNATLKNLSDITNKFGIHIIDQTNLFAIFNLFESNFINHYLNLLGSHPSELGNFVNTENFQTASYLLKYGTAIRALTGVRKNVANNLVADIMIVNNRQQRKVYVVSTSDILLGTNRSNIDDFFSISGLPKGQATKQWNNWVAYRSYNIQTREGDNGYLLARERITKFLIQVQKTKISMSMNAAALKSI